MKKLTPANEIFENEKWKLSKWQQFKINVKVDIICTWYKLKWWITSNMKL